MKGQPHFLCVSFISRATKRREDAEDLSKRSQKKNSSNLEHLQDKWLGFTGFDRRKRTCGGPYSLVTQKES